jgi:serine protease inhibitor
VSDETGSKTAPSSELPANSSLFIVNKLFIQNGPQIKQDFIGSATAQGLSVEQVDMNGNSAGFEEKLTAWLRAISGGRLDTLKLESGIRKPASLVLLNALYMPAALNGFSRVTDRKMSFHPTANAAESGSSRSIDFLARVGPVGLASFEEGSVTAVELELSNTREHALLCILLPAAVGSSFADGEPSNMLGRLEAAGFLSLNRYRRTVVRVELPVWRQDQTVDLLPALSGLGLPANQTDFSGLAADMDTRAKLELSDVRQRLVFELLEVRMYKTSYYFIIS